jgi:hypothetical protein
MPLGTWHQQPHQLDTCRIDSALASPALASHPAATGIDLLTALCRHEDIRTAFEAGKHCCLFALVSKGFGVGRLNSTLTILRLILASIDNGPLHLNDHGQVSRRNGNPYERRRNGAVWV